MNKGKNGTKTSSFGSPGRSGHDSSEFYGKKIYSGVRRPKDGVEYEEAGIPAQRLNKIFCKSSEVMSELPDNSVHLMVTSPPYNVGKDYDDDLTQEQYFSLLKTVFGEVYRVLVPGGRVSINIANVGRRPYISLNSEVIRIMNSIGFVMRGEIIWDKGASSGSSCAWGSWRSASNPTLRDAHEYITIFSKETLKRGNPGKRKDTITRGDFLELTRSVWKFNAESARKVKHPAPFPVELPRRIIQLYTFEGEVVLDPFMGVGSTAVAALRTNRNFVGYEVSKEYCDLAEERVRKESERPAGGIRNQELLKK